MKCHNPSGEIINFKDNLKILLMGNPNVGKSVIFSRLTGQNVYSGNYSGSTVSFTQGNLTYRGKKATLIDVPGIYSLTSSSPAEDVAIKLLNQGANLIICVLDATNLERNLNLALSLKKLGIPIIYALNLYDVAESLGIEINIEELERELEAPVVPTVAIRNIGLEQLLAYTWQYANDDFIEAIDSNIKNENNWTEVGRIVEKVQHVGHRHPTFWERFGNLALQPFPGLPIAFFILIGALALVVGGGKALRTLILLPLVNDIYVPLIKTFISLFISQGTLFNVLVGEYGVLVKGIEWPFALILPYVLLFYIVLSILEDSGYLPRLGVLVDGIMRRMGVQGSSIVPFIMGYGCAVPAILGTRAATSYKERLTIAFMVALAVPCVSQTGAFIALLGDNSVFVLVTVFLISFLAIFLTGLVINKLMPGELQPMVMEIPNLLKPDASTIWKKVKMRLGHFFVDAQGPLLIGIFLAALLVETGGLNTISKLLSPLVSGWLGLPAEASLALLLGVIRKELAVLPLLEMNLTTLQLLVGSVVALLYIPCLSVMVVLMREFGVKVGLSIGAVTIIVAFIVGGFINQIGTILALWL